MVSGEAFADILAGFAVSGGNTVFSPDVQVYSSLTSDLDCLITATIGLSGGGVGFDDLSMRNLTKLNDRKGRSLVELHLF